MSCNVFESNVTRSCWMVRDTHKSFNVGFGATTFRQIRDVCAGPDAEAHAGAAANRRWADPEWVAPEELTHFSLAHPQSLVVRAPQNNHRTPARTVRGSNQEVGTPRLGPEVLLIVSATPWLLTLNPSANAPSVPNLGDGFHVFSTLKSSLFTAGSSRVPRGSTRICTQTVLS